MRFYHFLTAAALAAPFAASQPALAAPGDPVKFAEGMSFDPIVEGRLRYEDVKQPATDADALTMRIRAGFELRHASGFSALVEGEGTLAVIDDYNAFPFAIVDAQRRPQFSVVADPMNVELNRAQLQYKGRAGTVTLGRQRINLDDQRWVGSVGWRQNEQTFDALRGEAKFGPVSLDGTYAASQRTIFGIEAGPRQSFDGDFFFLGAGVKAGPVQVKGFAYLLDYDLKEQAGPLALTNADTQTYGLRATAALPIAPKVTFNLTASYARQLDYQNNPFDFSGEYIAGEAGVSYRGLTLAAGYEQLGSDQVAPGVFRAVQTPMATLHKFNGWADLFLTTPNNGLQDLYAGATYKFDRVKAFPGLNAAVWYHEYDSDIGGVDFGSEWNASVGFKIGRVGILAKYANYDADGFGADTEKFWLQAEFAY